MNVLLQLRTAFNVIGGNTVSCGEQRVQEYIDGLNSFFEKTNGLFGESITIKIVDNTLEKKEDINKNILTLFDDKNIEFILFSKNDNGSVNKGAGLIDAWRITSDDIRKYNFIIHFEPRLTLINSNFFSSFLNSPRTIFSVNRSTMPNHFNTGLFSMQTGELLRFAESVNVSRMIDRGESIETLLYHFVKNNRIEYSDEKMNVIWKDSYKKENIIM